MIILNYFFFYSFLFFIGILGLILNRNNLILILVSIEMILLSITLNFNLFSFYLDDVLGEVFSLLILTVAAAESAIGLAIIIVYFRNRGTIDINSINLLSH
jgi:NADH-quinone oxidoreductase subunit K